MSPEPWPSWLVQGCGTEAAYRRHHRLGQPPDPACTEAATQAAANRRWAHQQRAAAAQWTGPPPVHWQHPAREPGTATCHGRRTQAKVTTRRHLVTCGTCKESRSWRTAA